MHEREMSPVVLKLSNAIAAFKKSFQRNMTHSFTTLIVGIAIKLQQKYKF